MNRIPVISKEQQKGYSAPVTDVEAGQAKPAPKAPAKPKAEPAPKAPAKSRAWGNGLKSKK